MKLLIGLTLIFLSQVGFGYAKNAPSPGMKSALTGAMGQPEYKDEVLDMGVRYQQTKISSAQVKKLNSTPVLLVASPGAGLALLPVAAYASMVYGSTTYVTNSDESLEVQFTANTTVGAGTEITLPYTFMESAASTRMMGLATTGSVPTANTGLWAHIAGGEPATGDSDIYVRVYYRIVPSALTN